MPRFANKNKNKNTENKAIKTNLSKLSVPKEELIKVIQDLNGNLSEVAKCFNLQKNRGLLYKLIAKYDLVEELRKARSYKNNLEELTKDLAIEINLEALLSMSLRADKLNKQDVSLLIFNLKACAKWVEATIKQDESIDDNSINQLLDKLNTFRQEDNPQ